MNRLLESITVKDLAKVLKDISRVTKSLGDGKIPALLNAVASDIRRNHVECSSLNNNSHSNYHIWNILLLSKAHQMSLQINVTEMATEVETETNTLAQANLL